MEKHKHGREPNREAIQRWRVECRERAAKQDAARLTADRLQLEELRESIVGFLGNYDLDRVKSRQAANEILEMCHRAGLRKLCEAK